MSLEAVYEGLDRIGLLPKELAKAGGPGSKAGSPGPAAGRPGSKSGSPARVG